MLRIVSVWLPAWPIERLARACRRAGLDGPWTRPDWPEPLALVEGGVHGLRLTAVNARSWKEGLRPGLALADARAALPALATRPAEPERDRAALAALASWIGRYGPARNVEGDDGLWVDATGVAHLFGGEARLLDDLVARLAGAGISARAGLADTPGAAHALARFATGPDAPWRIAPPGAARQAIATLPVEALRLPANGVLLLQRLGLRRIGQLYPLPREVLAQRFRDTRTRAAGGDSGRRRPPPGKASRASGQAHPMAGAVLARLDQALGLAPEPRPALEEPPRHLARCILAEPLISAAGVGAALEMLAHDLAGQLTARMEGGTRFVLVLYRVDGTAQEVCIGASRPCRDAAHLIALLADRIDCLDAGFGIDAMTLVCVHAEPLDARQIALCGAGLATREAETAALLDRLSNRLGAARVVRLVPVDSHTPERAQRRVPVLAEAGQNAAATSTAGPVRPTFLLATPEPMTVLAEVPEGPPMRFTWRRLTHRIVRAEGPERIEPEWWRIFTGAWQLPGGEPAAARGRPRDYYTIEDEEGGRYWVFRAGLYGREDSEQEASAAEAAHDARARMPVWFMHGVFG